MREMYKYVPDSVFEVTKSDTSPLAKTLIAFCVETDGFIKVLGAKDTTPTTFKVAAGVQYTVLIKQVFDTGTTCGTVWGFL